MRGAVVLTVIGAVLSMTGCAEVGPPPALANHYSATAVNGEAVPVRRFHVISNEAGSCEVTFLSSDVLFRNGDHYDLFIDTSRRCAGQVQAVITSERSQGTFTRSGSRLIFAPAVHGVSSPVRADMQGRTLLLEMIRNDGTAYRVSFAPRS